MIKKLQTMIFLQTSSAMPFKPPKAGNTNERYRLSLNSR